MLKKYDLPPAEIISRHLRYNPETGWLSWRRAQTGRVLGGTRGCGPVRAGCNARGRWIVSFEGQSYYASRIAYLLMTGEDPGQKDMDHINGDPSDDRWENLRAITRSQNLYNRKAYKQNHKEAMSGYKGVYARGEKFVAVVCYKRKTTHIGTYKTDIEAARAVARFFEDKGLLQFQPKEVQDLLVEAA
jgi:hypothetical protein